MPWEQWSVLSNGTVSHGDGDDNERRADDDHKSKGKIKAKEHATEETRSG